LRPFYPNFLRPIPDIEDEDIILDGFWLNPGIMPEPYWDFTIGNDCGKVKGLVKKSY